MTSICSSTARPSCAAAITGSSAASTAAACPAPVLIVSSLEMVPVDAGIRIITILICIENRSGSRSRGKRGDLKREDEGEDPGGRLGPVANGDHAHHDGRAPQGHIREIGEVFQLVEAGAQRE